MKFFKSIFRKANNKETKGAFFGSSAYELKNMLCGIGESKINDSTIQITEYPFKPSSAYPEKLITVNLIDAVCLDSYPPFIKKEKEAIFISRVQLPELEDFVGRNQIPIVKPTNSWTWILEPYLDTEYTDDTHRNLIDLLSKKGITEDEVNAIRAEVKEKMFKYNFNTMLWEWGMLDLSSVLAAMRVKYNDEQFRDFYWRAMEIHFRNNKIT
ncbi:hypothetical protein [Pontibacter actiniarum]|uniref:Uncharacterized protein n=1 Tax=Pontibacter actiniarum TaxID=323450 RepID=A0A1X9YS14_9BACT|nr:hypothetical protein [Pontibacter actiniarum]ARS35680.1 hypothetical protein CA264_09640 [Pontibacter actiniarum]